ncbi:ATP-binding protein [Streptomyces sp. NPDC020917]|uniref:ATP-binding protein n=1 Tax=Streptomyces sp. NPDC020917 TaxID=3365102 RepID=UPI0037882C26
MTKPTTVPVGFRVEAETVAVSEARHKIQTLVRNWDLPLPGDALRELELLSSEVITNALRYSDASCAVTVRWTGARVRVEVTDTSSAHPKPRESSPDSEGGRGLLLVDALAADWGTTADPAGKIVWFEVGPGTVPSTEQPSPWSTPGAWTITTTEGIAITGHLPAWAEDDPTEVNVPPQELSRRLAMINHRAFFDGPTLPITAPDLWDGVEEDSVLEGSIDCNPYDPDPGMRMPVVNLQVSVGRWILGLDPQRLSDIAARLRAHADVLDHKVRPALIAARDDWASHHPQ